MEQNEWLRNPSEIYDEITSFDDIMFLVDPIRAVKFGEFLTNISDSEILKIKLMRAVKTSSFWYIADAFKKANWNYFKELWEKYLPETINDFLDELEKNEEIDFSTNDIIKIKNALEITFKLPLIEKPKWYINKKVSQLLTK